jgi:hypothetical protein
MKKKHIFFVVSIALLLFSYPAHSQIKIGIQGGANFASINPVNDPTEFENKTQFMGGVVVQFKISNMFYIQPEVNYLPKGTGYTMSDPSLVGIIDPRFKVDYILNYIEIPINCLAKFDAGSFRPFLFAGPSLSFLSSKPTMEIKHVETGISETTDIQENIETTDFSVNFGAGIDFILSSKIDLFIMARYSLGMTSIYKDKSLDGEAKTQGIAITAGLKFGF